MIAVVAVDLNWAIGYKGKLLFDLPKDRQAFRRLTLGKTIVYGSSTLRSFPKGQVLPGRRNVILSRNPNLDVERGKVVHSIYDLQRYLRDNNIQDAYVIGGEMTYRQLLPSCDRVIVTKIFKTAPNADAYFPHDLDNSPDWTITERATPYIDNGITCQILHYSRVKN